MKAATATLNDYEYDIYDFYMKRDIFFQKIKKT